MDKYSCSLSINRITTNICLIPYRNQVFIILTQYEKLGSMITASKESVVRDFGNPNETYSIKTIFGKDDIVTHAATRYIAEHINIDRPILLSISLKNYELSTLKLIVKAINQIKPW